MGYTRFWQTARMLFLSGVTFGNQPATADESNHESVAAARMSDDLKYLASDELAGRGVGTEGIAQAAEFIAKRFGDLGLATNAFHDTPFQDFSIKGPSVVGPPDGNSLVLTGKGLEAQALRLGVDFLPLSLGSNGNFSGPLAFAGYGITATEYGYDDYAEFDATGKVVIVIRKEPQQEQENSKFEGKQNSQYAFFTTKELNASMHKAAALILVNDSVTAKAAASKIAEDLKQQENTLAELHKQTPSEESQRDQFSRRIKIAEQQIELLKKKLAEGAGDALLGVNDAGMPLRGATVPTLFCTRAVVSRWLTAAGGKSLAELESAIDRDCAPHSFLLEEVQCAGETTITTSQTSVRNVIATVPGSGDLANEYVVVGAHYDHVGMGGQGSLAPGTVAVHNGADDNASGTVTMLEVARNLSQNSSRNRRTLIFMAFSAEESGLLGSVHYVRNPRYPLEKTVTMINLDMVGRLNNEELTVYGTGTAADFSSQIDRLNERYGFKVVKVPQGKGASDHASFYDARIPVFHFFTGLHNDYHRPSDDVGKLNVSGMVRISRMISDLTLEIAEKAERPKLVEVQGSASPRSQNGNRATLGVRLERSPGAEARVTSVNEGGAAASAGIQENDIIVEIKGMPIENVGQLREVMGKLKSGEKVQVTYRRNGMPYVVSLTLGE